MARKRLHSEAGYVELPGKIGEDWARAPAIDQIVLDHRDSNICAFLLWILERSCEPFDVLPACKSHLSGSGTRPALTLQQILEGASKYRKLAFYDAPYESIIHCGVAMDQNVSKSHYARQFRNRGCDH